MGCGRFDNGTPAPMATGLATWLSASPSMSASWNFRLAQIMADAFSLFQKYILKCSIHK